MVGGVGRGGSAAVCAVGAELLASGCHIHRTQSQHGFDAGRLVHRRRSLGYAGKPTVVKPDLWLTFGPLSLGARQWHRANRTASKGSNLAAYVAGCRKHSGRLAATATSVLPPHTANRHSAGCRGARASRVGSTLNYVQDTPLLANRVLCYVPGHVRFAGSVVGAKLQDR